MTASPESTELRTRPISYQHGSTELTGELHWSPVVDVGPGLLLIHGGAGLDDHARAQAARYASLGFVVLACDMLGTEVRGDRARTIASLIAMRDDPDLLTGRARAGLTALSTCPEVDGPMGAIGFCFGGMAALELARSAVDLKAVVSVHGTLRTSRPARPGQVQARVLVCHGAADPHVPMSDVADFAREMDEAEADWQLIVYGGALHGFTHEHAASASAPGVAYSPAADRRSFAAIADFLAAARSVQAPGS